MKIQDLSFLIIVLIVVGFRNPRLLVGLGIVCLILAMPLFAKWVFFTAERLTWYAAAFFLLAIVQSLWRSKGADRN